MLPKRVVSLVQYKVNLKRCRTAASLLRGEASDKCHSECAATSLQHQKSWKTKCMLEML